MSSLGKHLLFKKNKKQQQQKNMKVTETSQMGVLILGMSLLVMGG